MGWGQLCSTANSMLLHAFLTSESIPGHGENQGGWLKATLFRHSRQRRALPVAVTLHPQVFVKSFPGIRLLSSSARKYNHWRGPSHDIVACCLSQMIRVFGARVTCSPGASGPFDARNLPFGSFQDYNFRSVHLFLSGAEL